MSWAVKGQRSKVKGQRTLDLRLSTVGRIAIIGAFVATMALLSGCRQEMYDQPKYKPLGKNDFFPDSRNERPLPDGTVARGFLRADSRFYRGTSPDGKSLVMELPIVVTPRILARGRERYD